MGISSVHLNGNLLCAVDVETTGLVAGTHEITQICIMPVTPDLRPSKEIPMFHVRMRPMRDNADLGEMKRENLIKALNDGLLPDRAETRLREWFEKLPLRPGKRITPLGHNYTSFDKAFIVDWLGGPYSYEEFFRHDVRDTMTTALAINDMADYHSKRIPFPKYTLSYVCRVLGFENEGAHDAVMDCMATIEAYRRIMRYADYADPTSFVRLQPRGDQEMVRPAETSDSEAQTPPI